MLNHLRLVYTQLYLHSLNEGMNTEFYLMLMNMQFKGFQFEWIEDAQFKSWIDFEGRAH